MTEYVNVSCRRSDRGTVKAASVLSRRKDGGDRRVTYMKSGEQKDFVLSFGRELVVTRYGPVAVQIRNTTSTNVVAETYDVDLTDPNFDVDAEPAILDDVLGRGKAMNVAKGNAVKIT